MAIMEQRILKGVFAQKKGVALAELHMLLEKVISNTTNQGTLLISVITDKYKELHSEVVSQFRSANTILCMCKVSQLEILNSFGNCSSC